jgi:hypothetical protein
VALARGGQFGALFFEVEMDARAWHIHMARIYLAQAQHVRRYPQHSAWHATLLSWAAKRRLQAMACKPEPVQQELFGE